MRHLDIKPSEMREILLLTSGKFLYPDIKNATREPSWKVSTGAGASAFVAGDVELGDDAQQMQEQTLDEEAGVNVGLASSSSAGEYTIERARGCLHWKRRTPKTS